MSGALAEHRQPEIRRSGGRDVCDGILARIRTQANPADTRFGLLAWKGGRVRQQDILVAKNYLA